MNALVVSGGTIEDKFLCDVVKNGAFEMIIAADSGIDVLYRNHITPDIIVGDFDSANAEALSYYKDMDQVSVTELNPVKDDTDTEHAVRDCIRLGFQNITLVGATGDRIDHVLSNISLLGVGLEYNVEITLLDPKNRIRLHRKSFTINKSEVYGDYISVLPYQGKVSGVRMTGMKYNLDGLDMEPFSSLGVSNEIAEEKAEVTFEEGYLLVIESRD